MLLGQFETRLRFPPPPLPKHLKDNGLQESPRAMAAPGQRRQSPERPSPAFDDADPQSTSENQSVCLPAAVAWIADAWSSLPPHIREAMLTFIDASAHYPEIAESTPSMASWLRSATSAFASAFRSLRLAVRPLMSAGLATLSTRSRTRGDRPGTFRGIAVALPDSWPHDCDSI